MVAAGWYQDPSNPQGYRYWDGNGWTEQVQAAPQQSAPQQQPTPAQDATQIAQPQAQAGAGPVGAQTPNPGQGQFQQPAQTPGGIGQPQDNVPPVNFAANQSRPQFASDKLNDIGDWLGRSFKLPFSNFGATAVLVLLPATMLIFLPYLLFYLLASSVNTNDLDNAADGGEFFEVLGVSSLVVPLITFFVMALVLGIGSLASSYTYYSADVGKPKSVGEALAVGLAKFPKFFGISILFAIPIYLVLLVPIALIGLGTAQEIPVLIIFGYIFYLAAYAFVLFYQLTKSIFVEVACAVTPRGQSAMKGAWSVSQNGRFWPIVGRMLLVNLISGAIIGVVYVVAIFAGIAVIGATVASAQDLPFATAQLGDYLPNPIFVLLFSIVLGVMIAAASINRAAAAALYADARMPNSLGHE